MKEIISFPEATIKCTHEWKLMSEGIITMYLEKIPWFVENYQCQTCLSLKQEKRKFR